MKHVNRKGTYSIKVDALKKYYGREELLPLWVADMDFETPQCVREAIQSVVDGGVYGYNHIPDNYFPTIVQWLKEQQKWEVEREWLTFIPGIVKGIGYVINYFTKPGDGVIVQPPVYPPFLNVPKGNGRKLVFNPLVRVEDGSAGATYRMDFENLREVASKGDCKVLILSNPHNPGGIAWDAESLRQLAAICHEHNILVVSDEIHADMPLFGTEHIPFASVSKEAAQISITFGAPSKTFNMAGIVSSYAVVPNRELREPFYKWMQVNELSSPTIFATLGAIAAYTKGNGWRMKMLDYIEGNVVFVEDFCKQNFCGLIKPMRPLSSFLVWLDCRELSNKLFGCIDQQRLVHLFVAKAGLALNDGAAFGPGGEGYMRLNVGCGREMLQEAMDKLKEAVNEYQ
ncbi:MAG: PatB family C-S lyase [Bacteroidales bacterium]|nr:PatB family C-S lyase [Bacteroidales bacterium]